MREAKIKKVEAITADVPDEMRDRDVEPASKRSSEDRCYASIAEPSSAAENSSPSSDNRSPEP